MKIINLFFLSVVLIWINIGTATAQTTQNNEIETIVGSPHENGGYGGFSIGYTRIDYNYNAFIIGGKGAWVINHSLGIGGALYGYSHIKYNEILDLIHGEGGGYAGLLLEPVFWAKHPVNLSVPMIIGGGMFSAFANDEFIYDGFFIFSPGLELQFNITKSYRMALGLDYRLTSKIDSFFLENLVSPEAPRGFSVHLVFKFGKY